MTIRIDGTNTAANPGITGTDTDTGLQFGTDEINVVTGGSTRATVDSSGRILIGTTTSAQVGGTAAAFLQLDSNGTGASRISIVRRNSGATGPQLTFGKTNGSGNEAVTDGDSIGRIEFAAGDGTDLLGVAARIECRATADAATDNTPGRIRFFTTPSGSNSPTVVGQFQPDGDFEFNSGYGSVAPVYGVRAWINFDGTAATIGTGRGSGNMDAVTDHGTGDYTVNFTTDMPDVNYAVFGASGLDGSTASSGRSFQINKTSPTVGSLRFSIRTTSAADFNDDIVCVCIVR